MTADTDATVLLAKGLDKDNKVVEVRGTPFYREGSTVNAQGTVVFTGLADSIGAVENAGLIRAPAYWLAEGRVAAVRYAQSRGDAKLALQEPVWSQWHDALGDMGVFDLQKSYGGFQKGVWVADVVNGTVFSHDPERIRDAVVQRNGQSLQSGAVRLTPKDADLLFGEGMVYAWRGGRMQPVKAQVYRSGAEFLEASASPHFLDHDPVYVVMRPAEEAVLESSGYQSISEQLENTGLAIRLGGKQMVRDLLVDEEGRQYFGWTQFCSHHRNYTDDVNGGRVVFLGGRDSGVSSSYYVSILGRPVGVAPEALQRRATIVAPLPLEVTVNQEAAAQKGRMVPEDHVRQLLFNLGYQQDAVDVHMSRLPSYAQK